MAQKDRSLFERHPRTADIPLTLLLAVILLGYGLWLPVITFKELVFWKHTFSVLSGILSLWQEKEFVLAVIIVLFSVIFPLTKLIALAILWFFRMSGQKRTRFIQLVNLLGKWSMLDVFVVAITIVITKFSRLLSAEPQPGIYSFAASILLSMLVAGRIENFALKSGQNLI